MSTLSLYDFHHALMASFSELNGAEIVTDYGDVIAEHAALRANVGVIDLSFRSRICLTGADRVRFLHGQVTNDVKRLRAGEGCYAALTTTKGKMESDLNIYFLEDELLLDFEPELADRISQRLEKYIVADDVQVVNAAPHYGLLSVQGPKAENVVAALDLFGWGERPREPLGLVKISDPALGEVYLVNHPRLGSCGFDLFIPNNSLGAVADKLIAAAKQFGGRTVGWNAFETARIEAGVPRFGADMDETNIPLECGIEDRAVSYNKGCYIGQEVINRIHSIGHVTKQLSGLRLADDLPALPSRGDKLFHASKEIGYITSAVKSPTLNANIALGYVRYEVSKTGNELALHSNGAESPAKIVDLPFAKPFA